MAKRHIACLAALSSCGSMYAENFSLPNTDKLTTWLIVAGMVVLSCLISAGWRRLRAGFWRGTLSFLQGVVIIVLTYLCFWILVVHTHYGGLASLIVWPLEKFGCDGNFIAITVYLGVLLWLIGFILVDLIIPLCRVGCNGLYVVLTFYVYLILFFTGMSMIDAVNGFLYLLMAFVWIIACLGLYGNAALRIRKWRCNKCGKSNDGIDFVDFITSPGRSSVSYNRNYEGSTTDYGAYGSDYIKRETATYGIHRKIEYYVDDTCYMRCCNCGYEWSVTVSRKTGEHSERVGQSDETTTWS